MIGVTGGLAAPLVAAGAGAVLGAGGAAALGSATGIAIMASLFGAAGAGLTGELIIIICRVPNCLIIIHARGSLKML